MNRKTPILISAKLTLKQELQDFLLMTIQVQLRSILFIFWKLCWVTQKPVICELIPLVTDTSERDRVLLLHLPHFKESFIYDPQFLLGQCLHGFRAGLKSPDYCNQHIACIITVFYTVSHLQFYI